MLKKKLWKNLCDALQILIHSKSKEKNSSFSEKFPMNLETNDVSLESSGESDSFSFLEDASIESAEEAIIAYG